MSLHVSSTMCSSSGGQKLYNTASGIITPIGSRPVRWTATYLPTYLPTTYLQFLTS